MGDADPLNRVRGSSASDSSEEREKRPAFYRGFYDAEQRRAIKNPETSVGQAVAAAAFGAIPLAFLVYFVSRANARAALNATSPPGGVKKGGFMDQMMETMRKQMDPMGNKDFRVVVKDVRFKDVIGVPEALAEVQQYVNFLKTPEKFTRLGGRLPKGCLLTGKPGTGKTLLAKAVAGEADVPFFSCSGSDFIEVYAGSGPKRVRELFADAKKEAPSVIFVDEIDAVGSRSNGQGALGLSSEENRTVNQLLAELDGLQSSEAVVVFAATNFADNIDKALLREGRFDRKVEVQMPDRQAREDLFTYYLNKVTADDISAKATRLAGLTPGISPATICTIVNEAALAAAVAGEEKVTEKYLLPAIDDVLIGKKHRSRMSDHAARRVALHESGHTLVAWMLQQQSDVIKVSITPRANAAGFTQQVGREVMDMPTNTSLFTDICVMLGGRAAEITQHSDLTAGAQDDYQRATRTAINQFLAFGMSQNVGLLSYDWQRLDQGRMFQRHSDQAQHIAEREAAMLVDAARSFTERLLKENVTVLKDVSDALLEKKELLREDLERLIGPREVATKKLTSDESHALAQYTAASEKFHQTLGVRKDSSPGALGNCVV